MFHGPLLRTAQTALAFILQYGIEYGNLFAASHPVIDGMGSDELFVEMVTDKFDEAVRAGQNHVEALITAHGLNKVLAWATKSCLPAVMEMFAAIEDGETGIGFFHPPTVQLACWAAVNCPEIGSDNFPNGYCQLDDLEGFELWKQSGRTVIAQKIMVEPLD